MSGYYTKNEMYGEKFYQIPKVFFTNPFYKKNLKDREKIAWGLLRDRFTLSQKNNWFDEEGRVYLNFSQLALMEIFDCSKQTASDIKKALVKCNLLEVVIMGQGNCDRLYLKKPIVTKDDIYLIDKAESLEGVETSKNQTSKNQTSKRLKNRPLGVQKIDAINTDFSDTELKDKELVNKAVNKQQKIIDELVLEYMKKGMPKELCLRVIAEINFEKVKNVGGYLRGCLENVLHKRNLKHGLIESGKVDNVPQLYDWLS